jgi:phosphonopyruvate decarboxylase
MIEAQHFVEAARARGFEWYAGVPCSYLTPFINYVLQDSSLHYVSMANEGDAVALIAGVTLAGAAERPQRRGVAMMQNSGLGNAVSPLTSLTWTFRLPQLLIVTWRGQPGVADEPQHALMGPVTPAMLDTMEIRWELFPTEPDAVGPALDRATAHMDATGLPYALLMQKGSVAPYALKAGATLVRSSSPRSAAVIDPREQSGKARPSRGDALRQVVARTPSDSTAVLASTGFCGRELYAIDDRPNQLYMVGSMGCVVPLALGLALARPDLRVVALDGDGAALMRMGAFATVGAYGPANLQHLLLDNGAHDSTGGQATVSPLVSFAEIAAACGYASSVETADVDDIGTWLDAPSPGGPRFARLLTRTGTPADLPRPSMSPVEVKTRLINHFRTAARVH